MSPSTQPIGSPQAIDLGRIESGLAELWRSSAEQAQKQSGAAILRSCTQNLVAIVSDSASANTVEDIFSRLSGEHPSREIIVIVDPSGTERELDSWISARCQLPTAEGTRMCCEQIRISARGPEAAQEIAPTILALFISDLPTFVWWRDQSPFEMPGVRHVMEIADRVIVNSARFPDPHAGLKQMLAVVRDQHFACALGDFNWERLVHWRTMLAQFFDVATVRPYLEQIDRVQIEYAVTDPATARLRARALLLAGWLASRLGWKLLPEARIQGGRGDWQFNAEGRQVALTIAPVHSPDDIQGRLISAKLWADGENSAEFDVHRSNDRRYLETSCQIAGSPSSCRLIQPDDYTEADLLGHQLKLLSHDRVYEQALETACGLIEAAPSQ